MKNFLLPTLIFVIGCGVIIEASILFSCNNITKTQLKANSTTDVVQMEFENASYILPKSDTTSLSCEFLEGYWMISGKDIKQDAEVKFECLSAYKVYINCISCPFVRIPQIQASNYDLSNFEQKSLTSWMHLKLIRHGNKMKGILKTADQYIYNRDSIILKTYELDFRKKY